MTAHTAVTSNAFNSASFVSNGVDPRTGQYTVSVSLPEVNGNNLSGPALPVSLAFNPMNNEDSGYGKGWNLSLSQYDPVTQVLSLSTGETFKVDGAGAMPRISEQKLETFKFYVEGNNRYRVVHKSGLVEVLELRGVSTKILALPVRVYSALGHHIDLSYEPFGTYQRLHEVKQADGTVLLRLGYVAGTLTISYLKHDGTLQARYLCEIIGEQLRRIILPSGDNASWAFTYETKGAFTCMREVRSPTGAHEAISYLDAGHLFPGSGNRPALPRATLHVLNPGRGQASMTTAYTYSAHNFLGYGAVGLEFPTDHTDALYKVQEAYEYSTQQTLMRNGQRARSVEYTYNRYHLLTRQETINGNAKLINFTEYHTDDSLAFDLQPPQCQLPRTVTTRWALVNDPTQLRDEVERLTFDSFGNPLEKIASTGVRETWSYYSALGEEGCPPDPHGFTRNIKEHRVYPAPAPDIKRPPLGAFGPSASLRTVRPAPRYDDVPTLINRFTYLALPPLDGADDPLLVMSTQVDSQWLHGSETALLHTRHFHIEAPANPLLHGQPERVEEERNGHVTTTQYRYDLAERPGAVTYTDTVSHSLDDHTRYVVRQLDLLTGQLLEERSADGLAIAYEHDALRRLVSRTVAPDDARYTATNRYRYKLGNGAGEFAEHWEVNAQGVETWTESDGLGRPLRVSRQKADGSSDAQAFRLQYSATYGDEMDLLEDTRYDWLGDEQLALTQAYLYDDWDQCRRTIDSLGMGFNSIDDPFARTLTEWQDGMAKTVTHVDAAGAPERVEVFDTDGTRLAQQRSFYDGHGQLRETFGNKGERTLYTYDALGRAKHNVLPDGTRVEQGYPDHSAQALVARLRVVQGNRALPDALAGSREYDSLERLTLSQVGPRIDEYRYSGSQPVVEERITPSKRRIRYEYNLALGVDPIAVHTEQASTFEYDAVTAALTRAVSPTGTLEYQYDGQGQMNLERSLVDGQTRETRYQTSPGGRLLQRVDFSNLSTTYRYDAHGRVSGLLEGQLEATFEYNAQGQRERSTTLDLVSGNTLVTESEYDSLGREVLRVQRLRGAAEYRTTLQWNNDGQLYLRELRIGGQPSLLETFDYDARDRLVRHCCSGPDLPLDPYGNPIAEQLFYFDGLDNLLECSSYFADGTEDHALHRYADDDRCQLRSVSHSHPDYPAETLLSYDADGNLMTDADGRVLQYDSQGRLLQVDWPQGTALMRYRYDAHDHLLGVTQGAGVETLRFYQENQLRTTVQGDTHSSFVYDGTTPLGQQRPGDDLQTLLTLCGDGGSVLAEVKGTNGVKRTQYTAHGAASEALDSALGFNGEPREAATGWYLLGRGYRAYNPQLRCFHSPDSDSPFGAGGLNPYAYCLGNPIRYRDPSGHYVQQRSPNMYELAKLRAEAAKAAKGNIWKNLGMSLAFAIPGIVGGLISGGALAVVSIGLAVADIGVRTALLYEIESGRMDPSVMDAYDAANMALDLMMMSGGPSSKTKARLPRKGSFDSPTPNKPPRLDIDSPAPGRSGSGSSGGSADPVPAVSESVSPVLGRKTESGRIDLPEAEPPSTSSMPRPAQASISQAAPVIAPPSLRSRQPKPPRSKRAPRPPTTEAGDKVKIMVNGRPYEAGSELAHAYLHIFGGGTAPRVNKFAALRAVDDILETSAGIRSTFV